MDMTPQAWPEWYDGRHMSVTRPLIFWNSAKNTGLGVTAFAGQSSARSATHGTPSKPSATEMSHLPKR